MGPVSHSSRRKAWTGTWVSDPRVTFPPRCTGILCAFTTQSARPTGSSGHWAVSELSQAGVGRDLRVSLLVTGTA